MNNPIAFAVAALLLLATPGPTNTLLATSGAAAGVKRSAHLVGAELLGYLFSITTLALVVGPFVRNAHALGVALRVGCGAFLLYAAWRLWREGSAALTSEEPVRFRRVLVATALNPKAVVFAFAIVPYLAQGQVAAAAPYMAALGAMIGAVGLAWISLGAGLRAGAHTSGGGVARRVGALVLCLFAVLISGSAFSA